MKLYLVFLIYLVVAVRAEEKSAAPTIQERRGTEKQENDLSSINLGSPALYRISSKTGSAPAPSANVLNYNPQAIYTSQPINYVPHSGVKYAPSPIPAHIMFGFAPQLQAQQYEYEPQSVAYAQPATKSGTSGARHAAAPAHTYNFSPASEVSSFRFSSPLVTYSNQGVLSQVIGKAAGHAAQESQSVPVAKSSAAPTPASQQVVYSSAPQLVYNSIPQQQKQEYTQAPQEYQYVQSPQVSYSSAPQRLVYASQPSHNVAAKENYASAPRQYYALVPQSYAQQVGQAAALQLAYALGPQGGHGNPNSQQVYAVPQQVKYTNANAQEYSQ